MSRNVPSCRPVETTRSAGALEYRYGDSNPGFQTEKGLPAGVSGSMSGVRFHELASDQARPGQFGTYPGTRFLEPDAPRSPAIAEAGCDDLIDPGDDDLSHPLLADSIGQRLAGDGILEAGRSAHGG